jgi:uncharacterized protein YfeS
MQNKVKTVVNSEKVPLNYNLPSLCLAVDTMNLAGFIASKLQKSHNIASLKLEYTILTRKIEQMGGCLDNITVNKVMKDAGSFECSTNQNLNSKSKLLRMRWPKSIARPSLTSFSRY